MDEAAAVEISVLTPVYNAEDSLADTITAILSLEGEGLELILIDDGSTDRSPAIIQEARARHPGRIRTERQDNAGEASALNRGWSLARGRFVAIIEADVAPNRDWLRLCRATLDANPQAIAAGGWLETPPDDPWIARLAGYEVEAKLATKARSSAHLTSANVLYRREAFAIAGRFDEGLINASLDSVFNAALRRAGHELIFEPRARARHRYKATLIGYLRRQYAYARYRVYNEDLELYPADRALAILGVLDVAIVAAVAAALVCAPWWPVLRYAASGLVLPVLLHAPSALAFALKRRDPAALAFAPIAALRSLLAALGYALGWWEKRGKKKSAARSQSPRGDRRES